MVTLNQRLRVATNSLLGLSKGSKSFRWSSSQPPSPRAMDPSTDDTAAAGSSSADGQAVSSNAQGHEGTSSPTTASSSSVKRSKTKLKAKTVSKPSKVPYGAAYAGAPDDLMEQLGYSVNKDKNPELFPSLFNPKTSQKTGRFEIKPHKNSLHRDSFKLWYEQHGTGPTKILFHYGSHPEYSCVVFDNRGFANSDAPYGRYRTSCLAYDTLLLLDELGWTGQREVHVVGVSMGGMITLELAKIAPERFASIMLVSTTSGQGWGEKSLLTSLPPARGVATIGKLMGGGGFGMGENARARAVVEMLFPQKWLSEKHDKHPEGKTNREAMQEVIQWRAAFARQAPFHGGASQIGAVLTHRVTNKELAEINKNIPVITIMTGDEDNLVNPLNSEHLAENMPRARLIKLENCGHAISIQRPEEIHKALDEDIPKAVALIKEGGWVKSAAELQAAKAQREAEELEREAERKKLEAEAEEEVVFGASEEEADILSRAADTYDAKLIQSTPSTLS
ncbi:hypothetical protein OC846_001339 [Tilletia horrida]|uniref:AB hydrolase-1 domain-containing protein n=1 Tax=Tilletia horrida TaxID=155126 RepID=A0AAN6GSS7_9BASI|nr:hypothetical protein OC845_003531 [Tilletia horrida]KAK0556120.1 hypothetical protein OC846_001339 [Tilletia horrida]KAK0569045.1 hypothetical protein OC861_001287 [Tilletia horrida]